MASDEDVVKEALMVAHLVQVGDTQAAVLRLCDLMGGAWDKGWWARSTHTPITANPWVEVVGSS